MATFGSISDGAHYWNGELPLETDLLEESTRDYAWMSLGPVAYKDVAHVIIPKTFSKEWGVGPSFTVWTYSQDLDGLSSLLRDAAIDHHLSEYALEVKRF
jgi:hypothetical protein